MQTTTVGDAIVAQTPPRLDQWTAPEAEAQFNLLAESGVRKIVCDLSATEYISSAGLRVLLAAASHVERHGYRLAVCCASRVVRELFNVAGASPRFDFYETRQGALDHFTPRPSAPLIE